MMLIDFFREGHALERGLFFVLAAPDVVAAIHIGERALRINLYSHNR